LLIESAKLAGVKPRAYLDEAAREQRDGEQDIRDQGSAYRTTPAAEHGTGIDLAPRRPSRKVQ
jgi:hypothetical protein